MFGFRVQGLGWLEGCPATRDLQKAEMGAGSPSGSWAKGGHGQSSHLEVQGVFRSRVTSKVTMATTFFRVPITLHIRTQMNLPVGCGLWPRTSEGIHALTVRWRGWVPGRGPKNEFGMEVAADLLGNGRGTLNPNGCALG